MRSSTKKHGGINSKFKKLLKTDFDSIYSLEVDKIREWYASSWDDFKGEIIEVGSVATRIIKTSKRNTPIRIYYPKVEGVHPVFIWIHGGGFVLGNIEVYDSICRKITNQANCAVISQLSRDRREFTIIYQVINGDHLLYGSDYPYTPKFGGIILADALDKTNLLNNEQRCAVYHDNTLKLFAH